MADQPTPDPQGLLLARLRADADGLGAALAGVTDALRDAAFEIARPAAGLAASLRQAAVAGARAGEGEAADRPPEPAQADRAAGQPQPPATGGIPAWPGAPVSLPTANPAAPTAATPEPVAPAVGGAHPPTGTAMPAFAVGGVNAGDQAAATEAAKELARAQREAAEGARLAAERLRQIEKANPFPSEAAKPAGAGGGQSGGGGIGDLFAWMGKSLGQSLGLQPADQPVATGKAATGGGAGQGGASAAAGAAAAAAGPMGAIIGPIIEVAKHPFSTLKDQLAGMFAPIADAAHTLRDALMTPVAVFHELTGTAKGFVASLNPSTVMVFDAELRNVSAAIGKSLLPIIQAGTSVLREFNSAVGPLAEVIRPIVAQLSQSLGQVASVLINTFVSVAQALAPAFKFLADVFSAVVPVVQATAAAFAGTVEVLASFVKGLAKMVGIDVNFADGLKSALRMLAEATLSAAVSVLKFVDGLAGSDLAGDFARGASAALTGDGQERRKTLAAPVNAQLGDMSSFAANVSKNAMMATSVMPGIDKDKEEAEWRRSVARSVQKIADSGQWEERLTKKLDDIAMKIMQAVAGKVWSATAPGKVAEVAAAAVGVKLW